MGKAIVLALIPIMVVWARYILEDWRNNREQKPVKKKKAPEPKLYDHQWDDDDE